MRDAEAVLFLQWALPRLRMRWPGFRRVRGQVAKRLRRRLAELRLPDLAAYRHRLEADEGEWDELDARCRVTISRFLRDRAVWASLLCRRAIGRGAVPTTQWWPSILPTSMNECCGSSVCE